MAVLPPAGFRTRSLTTWTKPSWLRPSQAPAGRAAAAAAARAKAAAEKAGEVARVRAKANNVSLPCATDWRNFTGEGHGASLCYAQATGHMPSMRGTGRALQRQNYGRESARNRRRCFFGHCAETTHRLHAIRSVTTLRQPLLIKRGRRGLLSCAKTADWSVFFLSLPLYMRERGAAFAPVRRQRACMSSRLFSSRSPRRSDCSPLDTTLNWIR
eukprot:SAG31_NODE_5497_length_2500_cov_2.330696_3_plen_214_part_00